MSAVHFMDQQIEFRETWAGTKHCSQSFEQGARIKQFIGYLWPVDTILQFSAVECNTIAIAIAICCGSSFIGYKCVSNNLWLTCLQGGAGIGNFKRLMC